MCFISNAKERKYADMFYDMIHVSYETNLTLKNKYT